MILKIHASAISLASRLAAKRLRFAASVLLAEQLHYLHVEPYVFFLEFNVFFGDSAYLFVFFLVFAL